MQITASKTIYKNKTSTRLSHYQQEQIKYIPVLCISCDDRLEHGEVTWSLVHAVKAFYAKDSNEFDAVFIKIIDKDVLMPHAQGWLELLAIRTLNEEEARESFIKIL